MLIILTSASRYFLVWPSLVQRCHDVKIYRMIGNSVRPDWGRNAWDTNFHFLSRKKTNWRMENYMLYNNNYRKASIDEPKARIYHKWSGNCPNLLLKHEHYPDLFYECNMIPFKLHKNRAWYWNTRKEEEREKRLQGRSVWRDLRPRRKSNELQLYFSRCI